MFTFEDQPTSFQTLWQRVNQFASYLLDQGLRPKERVVIALPNGAEFFFVFYGVQRAAGIAVPLFPDLSAERIASIAKSCEARFVVLPEDSLKGNELEANGLLVLEFRSLLLHVHQQAVGLQNYPQVQPDDIAFLQYTSGSTGNPERGNTDPRQSAYKYAPDDCWNADHKGRYFCQLAARLS